MCFKFIKNWKNEKEWEIVKTKTIEYETKNFPVQITKEPRYAQREIKTDILGIFHFSQTYNQVVGESSNTTYEIRRRKKITDFDGKISYGDWEVVKTYSK